MKKALITNDANCITSQRNLRGFDCIITENIDIKIQLDGFIEVIILNSDKPMFVDETFEIVKEFNERINRLSLELNVKMYKLLYHIEGGTPQKIHDAIWMTDCILTVLKGSGITEVVCEKDIDYIMQCIVNQVCKSLNITLIEKRSVSSIVKKSRLMNNLTDVCRAIVRILRVASISCNKNVKRESEGAANNYDLIFVAGGFVNNKHNNGTLHSLNNYGKKIKSCILYIGEYDSVKELRDAGYTCLNLYSKFRLGEVIRLTLKYVGDKRKIVSTYKNSAIKAEYGGVNLDRLVNSIIDEFLCTEAYLNVLNDQVICTVVDKIDGKLITGKGYLQFYVMSSVYYNLKKRLDIKYFSELSEFYGVISSNCYDGCGVDDVNEVEFAISVKNSYAIERLIERGWNGKVCYTLPTGWDDIYRDKTRITEDYCVLWAPSCPSRGIYNYSNFLYDNEIVGKSLQNNVDNYYIKFHPSLSDKIEDKIKKSTSIDCGHVVNKNEHIEQYINRADIIITTPSAVISDALRLHKLIIVLVDERRLRYVNLVKDKLCVIDSDSNKLMETLADIDCLNELKERQEAFYQNIIDNSMGGSIENMLYEYCSC